MHRATQLRYETHVRALKEPNIMHRGNWISTVQWTSGDKNDERIERDYFLARGKVRSMPPKDLIVRRYGAHLGATER